METDPEEPSVRDQDSVQVETNCSVINHASVQLSEPATGADLTQDHLKETAVEATKVDLNNVVVLETAGESPKVVKMDLELPKGEPNNVPAAENQVSKSPSAEILAQTPDQEMANVDAEKPKPEKEPSPEPGPAFETASSSSGEKLGSGMQRRKLTMRRFRASSNSSTDDDDDDNDGGKKTSDAAKNDSEEKKTDAHKSKKKKFKASSSSSSSSTSSESDAFHDLGDAAETDSSSNDSFVSLHSNDSESRDRSSQPAAEGGDDPDDHDDDDDDDGAESDPLFHILRLGVGGFRFVNDDPPEPRRPQERPEVLDKPPAKPKYSFLEDYIDLQMSGRTPSFIRKTTAQLDLVRRFELSHKLKGHEGCVNSINFNDAGSLLASGSDDLKIFIWDWQKKRKAYSFKSGHNQNVFQSKFLPYSGDTHLVTSSRDGQVRLAVLSSTGVCRSTKKVAQHSSAAHKLALLDSCPQTFVSAGEDGLIIMVDVREPQPTTLLALRNSSSTRPIALYSVHANPANDFYICTAGKDSYVRVFDRRSMSNENPTPVKKFCPEHLAREDSMLTSITCAVYNYDGTEIIASYNDEEIYLFKTDAEDGSQFHKKFQGHQNSATVKGVNYYGPRSEYVVSGSDCGNIFFWDKETEGIIHMVHGDKEGVVNCLEPHPNLPVMATSGLDHSVKIWMPTSTKDPDTKAIEKAVMSNKRSHTDFSSDRMLSVLWRHISWMQSRRRARGDDDDNPVNDDSSSDDSSNVHHDVDVNNDDDDDIESD